MHRTLAASFLLLCTVGASPGWTAGTTVAKEPEVVTVGTTPVALTDADRAKLAEVERQFAARRATPAARVAAEAKKEVATRMASAGVRNRQKPGQAPMSPKPAPTPVRTVTTTTAPVKGGRP